MSNGPIGEGEIKNRTEETAEEEMREHSDKL